MAAPATATDVTREHYARPEVRDTIIKYCTGPGMIRALNGIDAWYKSSAGLGMVKLTMPGDYDDLIDHHRTLFATIDFFDESVANVSEKWDKINGAPENPIGTLKDCRAYTLSVDIDQIKGPNGENIVTSPAIKKAVEAACQFYVDYLKARGVSKSVHCLYSGGGCYVHVHHALFKAHDEWTPEDREFAYRSVTMAYNGLIAEIEDAFFKAHPEHIGKVKFDKLNNQKRKFKCVFSIHKKLPYVVIPLDPNHIEINFNKARLPLSDEVLAQGAQWYESYDVTEKEALKEILASHTTEAERELGERKAPSGTYERVTRDTPRPQALWPVCMKNIVETCSPARGPHRALAVLASYLYDAGWDEISAFDLWRSLADKVGVEYRIFYSWYGLMSCTGCRKIQRKTAGYPHIGLGGFNYCPGEC